METPADNLLGNIMAAHLDSACYARKRKPDIGNPQEEKMGQVTFSPHVPQTQRVVCTGQRGLESKINSFSRIRLNLLKQNPAGL